MGVYRPAFKQELAEVWEIVAPEEVYPSFSILMRDSEEHPGRVLVGRGGPRRALGILAPWLGRFDLLQIRHYGMPGAERAAIRHLAAVARQERLSVLSPLVRERELQIYLDEGFAPVSRLRTYVKLDRRPGPPPEWIVERLGDEYLHEVRGLDQGAFPPMWRLDPSELERMFQAGRVLGVRSGRLIGYAEGNLRGDHGTVARLAVSRLWRKRGVGGSLLWACLRFLWESGAKTVSLLTQEDNVASGRLYERFGFVRGKEVLHLLGWSPEQVPPWK